MMFFRHASFAYQGVYFSFDTVRVANFNKDRRIGGLAALGGRQLGGLRAEPLVKPRWGNRGRQVTSRCGKGPLGMCGKATATLSRQEDEGDRLGRRRAHAVAGLPPEGLVELEGRGR